MKTYLFQGDSITDAGRSRENDSWRGHGYATITAGYLGKKYAGEFNFINRGISGNRIVDVYARIKADIINLKPDYMSILIGVNDVWHEINHQNGVATAKFEKIYSMLIEEIKEALPDIKIIILEPFVLKGTATEENWETFKTGVSEKAQAAKRVAEKFSLPFVKLQEKFDEAMTRHNDALYWTTDGVHPSAFGHQIISDELVKAFEEIK